MKDKTTTSATAKLRWISTILFAPFVAADNNVVTFPLPNFQVLVKMNTDGVDISQLPFRLAEPTDQHLTTTFDKVLQSQIGDSISGGEESVHSIKLSATLLQERDELLFYESPSWRSSLHVAFEGDISFDRRDETTSLITQNKVHGIVQFAFESDVQRSQLLYLYQSDPFLNEIQDVEVQIDQDFEPETDVMDNNNRTTDTNESLSALGIALLVATFFGVILLFAATFLVCRRFCCHKDSKSDGVSAADDVESKGDKSTEYYWSSSEGDDLSSSSGEEYGEGEIEEGVDAETDGDIVEEGDSTLPTPKIAQWGTWTLAVTPSEKPQPIRRSRRSISYKKRKSTSMKCTLNVIEEEEVDDDNSDGGSDEVISVSSRLSASTLVEL